MRKLANRKPSTEATAQRSLPHGLTGGRPNLPRAGTVGSGRACRAGLGRGSREDSVKPPRLGGEGGPLQPCEAWQMLQAQEGTELGLPWLPSTWELPSREAQDPGGPPPPSSLGVGPVLGHGRLRGHQEKDVGFQVHHGLLLGLLGRVLGPGRGVHVKGDVGTSGPLDDGESADQLVEVLPVGTKPTLDSAPSARKWASAPLCSRKPWTTPPITPAVLSSSFFCWHLPQPPWGTIPVPPAYSVMVFLSLSTAGRSTVANK